MADTAASEKSGKVVIRHIGLLLSGDLAQPILDADTIVVVDGVITAVGRQADCDTRLGREQSGPHVVPLVLPRLRLSLRGDRDLRSGASGFARGLIVRLYAAVRWLG